MKVFIAGSFLVRPRLQLVAEKFRGAGHDVVSSWLAEPLDLVTLVRREDLLADWLNQAIATQDLIDLYKADALILFTEEPSSSGGYWVELGVAIARGIPVYVAGDRMNVYCYYPQVLPITEFPGGAKLCYTPAEDAKC